MAVDIRTLRLARKALVEARKLLNHKASVCPTCNRIVYDDWEEFKKYDEIDAVVTRLTRWIKESEHEEGEEAHGHGERTGNGGDTDTDH